MSQQKLPEIIYNMWLKIIEVLKFILKLLLRLMPASVIREYFANEKFIKKSCANLKATLNNIPALGKTKIDDNLIDFGVEPILLKLSGLLKKPDNAGIKWLEEKEVDLKKLTEDK